VPVQLDKWDDREALLKRPLEFCLFLFLGLTASVCYQTRAQAQEQTPEWQADVKRYVQSQDWASALRVLDREIARSPRDTDLRAWRARILTWSGHLGEAEKEYLSIAEIVPNDPDVRMGLGTVYMRQGRTEEALRALDRAVELDPKRSDLRAAHGRILRAAKERRESRLEFQRALSLDPTSAEARAGLVSLQSDPKHELRFGQDNDLLNFTNAYHDEWVSFASQWNSHWATNFAASFFQRAGVGAGKFSGSVTGRLPRWGAATVGGATGHDNGVIPRTEAFFDLDRGWNISESRLVRGMEFTYGQHWYWYATARILTVNGSGIVYFPGEWTWSLGMTGARSTFPGTTTHWQPSGVTRLGFPLVRRGCKRLSGNMLFAVGTEDFARVDQIGSFASQTYGGGLRFQFAPRQDVSGIAFYQKRTQGKTDLNFGLSYAIHF
jgi:tetratricopeptide (TPR) repeat protein